VLDEVGGWWCRTFGRRIFYRWFANHRVVQLHLYIRNKEETCMTLLLASSWWSLAIRGVVAVLVGLVALAWPGIALSALVVLFGAYALIDGLTAFAGAWRARDAHEKWGRVID
jgi:uncharacterized membrane protein HdeD (DUF308 family)